MAKDINKELFESVPIPQAVRKFVIPALLSTLITIAYNMADTIFIGMLNDPNQLAGMTVAFPYYQLLNAFSNLWGTGTNTVMSRQLGEKQYKNASRTSSHGFWGGFVFMMIVSVIFFALRRPLLILAGASSSSFSYAERYIFWTFVVGGLPTVLSIIMSNLLRAEGHAKKASTGLIMGGVLNCFLDPLFIFVFGLGVPGAAIATLVSNCVTLVYFLLSYLKMRESSYIQLSPIAYKINWKNMKDIVLAGLPFGCLVILGAAGCLVQTALYSEYSDIAVAAWGVVNRVSFIGINLTHGISQGVLPLISYNYGAKDFNRVRGVNKCAYTIMFCIAIALMAVTELFAPQIMRIFIADQDTILAGTTIMRCYMISTPFMGFILMTSTLCQALGKWQYSLLMLSVRQLLCNIPVTFLLHSLLGMRGVALGQPTCDVICLFWAIFIYRRCFYRALNREEAQLNLKEAEG